MSITRLSSLACVSPDVLADGAVRGRFCAAGLVDLWSVGRDLLDILAAGSGTAPRCAGFGSADRNVSGFLAAGGGAAFNGGGVSAARSGRRSTGGDAVCTTNEAGGVGADGEEA